MASWAEFSAAMKFMTAATNAPTPSEEQAAAYLKLLGDLSGDVLLAACERAVMVHQFPTLPPVGLIRREAAAIAHPAVTAAEAWEDVLHVARTWGHWLIELPTGEKTLARIRADLDALPPSALRAADAYGWQTILDTPASIASPQFARIFDGLDGPTKADAVLPPHLRAAEATVLTNGIGALPRLTGGRP